MGTVGFELSTLKSNCVPRTGAMNRLQASIPKSREEETSFELRLCHSTGDGRPITQVVRPTPPFYYTLETASNAAEGSMNAKSQAACVRPLDPRRGLAIYYTVPPALEGQDAYRSAVQHTLGRMLCASCHDLWQSRRDLDSVFE